VDSKSIGGILSKIVGYQKEKLETIIFGEKIKSTTNR